MWYKSLWLSRWQPHRKSKCQSQSTTVLFSTTLTQTIILHLLMSFTWCKFFFVLIICFFIFMTLDYIWWQEVYRTQSDNSGGQRSLQRHKSFRQIRCKVSLTKLLCISIVLTHIMSKESLRIKGNLFCFIKNVTSLAA